LPNKGPFGAWPPFWSQPRICVTAQKRASKGLRQKSWRKGALAGPNEALAVRDFHRLYPAMR